MSAIHPDNFAPFLTQNLSVYLSQTTTRTTRTKNPTTFEQRALSFTGLIQCNTLPHYVRHSPSASSFKQALKQAACPTCICMCGRARACYVVAGVSITPTSAALWAGLWSRGTYSSCSSTAPRAASWTSCRTRGCRSTGPSGSSALSTHTTQRTLHSLPFAWRLRFLSIVHTHHTANVTLTAVRLEACRAQRNHAPCLLCLPCHATHGRW